MPASAGLLYNLLVLRTGRHRLLRRMREVAVWHVVLHVRYQSCSVAPPGWCASSPALRPLPAAGPAAPGLWCLLGECPCATGDKEPCATSVGWRQYERIGLPLPEANDQMLSVWEGPPGLYAVNRRSHQIFEAHNRAGADVFVLHPNLCVQAELRQWTVACDRVSSVWWWQPPEVRGLAQSRQLVYEEWDVEGAARPSELTSDLWECIAVFVGRCAALRQTCRFLAGLLRFWEVRLCLRADTATRQVMELFPMRDRMRSLVLHCGSAGETGLLLLSPLADAGLGRKLRRLELVMTTTAILTAYAFDSVAYLLQHCSAPHLVLSLNGVMFNTFAERVGGLVRAVRPQDLEKATLRFAGCHLCDENVVRLVDDALVSGLLRSPVLSKVSLDLRSNNLTYKGVDAWERPLAATP